MGLRINTNTNSLRSQANLANAMGRIDSHFARLASGLRIQSASDDAAGLGISERMRVAERSMTVATRNIQDGISMARVAEGQLEEVSSLLIRAKELAIRGMTGTLSPEDSQALDVEYQEIASAVRAIHHEAEFNGISLFDIGTSIDIQVGQGMGDTIPIQLPNLAFFGDVMGLASITDPATGADAVNFVVDTLIPFIAQARGAFGAVENRLEAALRSTQSARDSLAESGSRIRDVDVASETALLTRDSILQQAGVAVLSQANIGSQLALTLIG